jgi:hypothetical protein
MRPSLYFDKLTAAMQSCGNHAGRKTGGRDDVACA